MHNPTGVSSAGAMIQPPGFTTSGPSGDGDGGGDGGGALLPFAAPSVAPASPAQVGVGGGQAW